MADADFGNDGADAADGADGFEYVIIVNHLHGSLCVRSLHADDVE